MARYDLEAPNWDMPSQAHSSGFCDGGRRGQSECNKLSHVNQALNTVMQQMLHCHMQEARVMIASLFGLNQKHAGQQTCTHVAETTYVQSYFAQQLACRIPKAYQLIATCSGQKSAAECGVSTTAV